MSKQKVTNSNDVDDKSTNKKSNNKNEFAKSLKKKEPFLSVSKEANKLIQNTPIDTDVELVDEKGKLDGASVEKPSKKSELQLKQEAVQISNAKQQEKNDKNSAIHKTVHDSAQIKEGHNNVQSNITQFSSMRPNEDALQSAFQAKKAATESKKTKNNLSGTKQSKTQIKNEEKSSIANLSIKHSKKKEIHEQKQQILPSQKQIDYKLKEQKDSNGTSIDQAQISKNDQEDQYVPDKIQINRSKTKKSVKRARPADSDDDEGAQAEYKSKVQSKSIAKSSKNRAAKSEKKTGKSMQKQSKSAIKSMKKVKVNAVVSTSQKK